MNLLKANILKTYSNPAAQEMFVEKPSVNMFKNLFRKKDSNAAIKAVAASFSEHENERSMCGDAT